MCSIQGKKIKGTTKLKKMACHTGHIMVKQGRTGYGNMLKVFIQHKTMEESAHMLKSCYPILTPAGINIRVME